MFATLNWQYKSAQIVNTYKVLMVIRKNFGKLGWWKIACLMAKSNWIQIKICI